MKTIIIRKIALGEARTLDLRISLSILTYKYDALTDCATRAETHSLLRSCKVKRLS